MSWDSYIDNVIAQSRDPQGSAHIARAGIIGIDGGASWTTQGHAQAAKITDKEGSDIASCFKSGIFDSFMAGGIHLEGTKYQFLRVEDGKVVFGKKAKVGSCCLYASKTAITIAISDKDQVQENASKAAAVIADYLESMGM